MADHDGVVLAYANVCGEAGVRVMRDERFNGWVTADVIDRSRWHSNHRVTGVRPLVVLDFSIGGPYLAHNVADAIRGEFPGSSMNRIADEIERQAGPPKPPEPQAFGAIVQDLTGQRWVRCDDDWRIRWHRHDGQAARYADLAAVEVLSEGVVP